MCSVTLKQIWFQNSISLTKYFIFYITTGFITIKSRITIYCTHIQCTKEMLQEIKIQRSCCGSCIFLDLYFGFVFSIRYALKMKMHIIEQNNRKYAIIKGNNMTPACGTVWSHISQQSNHVKIEHIWWTDWKYHNSWSWIQHCHLLSSRFLLHFPPCPPSTTQRLPFLKKEEKKTSNKIKRWVPHNSLTHDYPFETRKEAISMEMQCLHAW